MGKLRVLSGREACKILEAERSSEVRRRGSHIVMQKRSEDTTTTVPVPDHPELKVGTLASIIRQSGLARSLFEREPWRGCPPEDSGGPHGYAEFLDAIRDGRHERHTELLE